MWLLICIYNLNFQLLALSNFHFTSWYSRCAFVNVSCTLCICFVKMPAEIQVSGTVIFAFRERIAVFLLKRKKKNQTRKYLSCDITDWFLNVKRNKEGGEIEQCCKAEAQNRKPFQRLQIFSAGFLMC